MTDRLDLPLPGEWTALQRRAFLKLCRQLSAGADETFLSAASRSSAADDAGVVAASAVVKDLVAQGWTLSVVDRAVSVEPPTADADPNVERARVRRQELLKRDSWDNPPASQLLP